MRDDGILIALGESVKLKNDKTLLTNRCWCWRHEHRWSYPGPSEVVRRRQRGSGLVWRHHYIRALYMLMLFQAQNTNHQQFRPWNQYNHLHHVQRGEYIRRRRGKCYDRNYSKNILSILFRFSERLSALCQCSCRNGPFETYQGCNNPPLWTVLKARTSWCRLARRTTTHDLWSLCSSEGGHPRWMKLS